MEFGRDLLVRGIGAAKAKSWDEARFFFEKLLGGNAPVEMRVEAWRYLADMSSDPDEKREYVGRILAVDPTDGFARRTLAVLDGRLNPADIVDPDLIPTSAGAAAPARAEQLRCPQCGSGNLVASADGRCLVCEHCQYEKPIGQSSPSPPLTAHDFAAAIWTQKGHRKSLESMLSFVCDGCGASFVLSTGIQSRVCPFCGSSYVDADAAPRELIKPDAILPFGPGIADVRSALKATMGSDPASGPASEPQGVYLPVWMFNFTGSVHWTGFVEERDGLESRRRPVSGDDAVIEQKILVSASRALPAPLEHLVDGFSLSPLIPYDARQLAGCLVAAYELSLDEASIPAREKAVKALRAVVKKDHAEVSDMEMTFGRIDIDAFQLLLFPFWSAQVGTMGARRLLFVNGQTGAVGPDAREHGFFSWIFGIIDGK